MHARTPLTFIAACCLVTCGGNTDSGVSPDVSGRWCGRAVATAEQCTGGEVEYVELTQVGSTVTGQVCEAFAKECYAIQGGALQGGQLSFYYTFSTDRVDARLTSSGNTLVGTFSSTKAPEPIPITLTRIP